MRSILKKGLIYVWILSILINACPVIVFASFFQKEEMISNLEEISLEEEKQVSSKIVGEILEKRTINEKHYRLEDGSMKAYIYPEAIHYEENGEFIDIDNTLVASSSGFKNKKNNLSSEFSKEENILTLSYKDHVISWQMKEVEKVEGEIEGGIARKILSSIPSLESKFIYSNVLKDIDLEYELVSDRIEENIIIKNKESLKTEYTYFLKTEDLTMKQLTNNEIVFLDKGGKEIFYVSAPVMYDSDFEFSSDIVLAAKKLSSGYEIKLKADEKWLTSEERIYPITIDPIIATSPNRDDIIDTFIYPNDASNTGKGNAHILRVGSTSYSDLGQNKNPFRSLVKFSLPSLTSGDQVIDAELHIFNYQNTNDWTPPSGNIQIDIHAVTKDWNESNAYWNNMKDAYNSQIIDYIKYTYDSNNQNKENTANITRLVKDWYTTGNNYGLLLKEHVEKKVSGRNDVSFISSDTSSAYTYKRPYIIIQYRNQTGLEGYLTTHTQSIGRTTTLTNDYNGNLTLIHSDASTPGNRLPVSINHVYNTNDKDSNIGYGNGFRLNLNQTLKSRNISGIEYLEYIDEDATRHYFYKDSNTWKDEDGLNLTITASGTNYIMKDKGGNESLFVKNNDKWYLKEIKDTNNNKITINYASNPNLITSVQDAVGDTLTLTYSNNLLTNIKDKDNRVITYGYNSNNLTSITYPDALKTQYQYTNTKLLSKVIDVDNSSILYTYYSKSPYRIKSVTEYGSNGSLGNSITMTYGNNTTSFKDNKNHIENYTFNHLGQTLNINSLDKNQSLKNAYGVSYQYGTSASNKNKLLLETPMVKATNNAILNSSAENNLANWNLSNWGSNTGNASISNDFYLGKLSYKLESTTQNSNPILWQSTPMLADETYTLSAYLKGNVDAYFFYEYKDSTGIYHHDFLGPISLTDSFERYSKTFTIPSDSVSNTKIGISIFDVGAISIDNVQLEEGIIANPYNLAENGNFTNGRNGWDSQANLGSNDKVVDINGIKAFQMMGEMEKWKHLYKTIPISGKKGDSFHVSFWAKNNGVPIGNSKADKLVFQYLDGSGTILYSEVIDVLNDTGNWQYLSSNFVAKQDYESLKVILAYNYNTSYSYFTNIGVYKDEVGNSYTYDANGNVISTSDLAKQNSTYTYNRQNELIRAVNPKGRVFYYEYDYNHTNRLLHAFNQKGLTSSYEYDEYGNIISNKISEPTMIRDIGDIKENTYYYVRPIVSNLMVGEKNSNVELIDGEKKWKFVKNGEDYYIVDENSKAITVKDSNTANGTNILLANLNNGNNQKYKLSYNNDGTFSFQTKVTNYKSCIDVYDGVFKAGNNITEYACNLTAAQKYIILPLESSEKYIETKAQYSENGNYQTKVIDQRGKEVTTTYNESRGTISNVLDAKGNKTEYTYDSNDRVTQIKSGSTTNTYTYDKDYLKKINHNGFDYEFTRDEYGNTTSIKVADNPLITHQYEASNGYLLKSTYGNNQSISYEYDSFGRISKKINTTGTATYTYNNRGSLAHLNYLNNDYYYTYDLSGRITNIKENNLEKKYQYDNYNNLSKVKYKYNTSELEVSYTYDEDDKITTITYPNYSIHYTYDTLDRLIKKEIIKGDKTYTTTYEYYNVNDSKTTSLLKSITNGSNKLEYTYDNNGNIISITNNGTLINQYEYDSLNQLISDCLGNLQCQKYYYDSGGNRTKVEDVELIFHFTGKKFILVPNVKSTFNYTYDSDWKDQLTKADDKSITYDLIGNMTSYNGYNYAWTNGNELKSITQDNNKYEYEYNIEGIRTKKIVNGKITNYYLEGNNILYEDREGKTIEYLYDESGISGLKADNKNYYFVKNIQGDIIEILDEEFNVVANYTYDAWGKVTTENLTEANIGDINPYRYRGYYYDTESSLYYLNSRYYNPSLGRFISADSILGANGDILAYNLYAYCSNNPIMFSDSSGTEYEEPTFRSFIRKLVLNMFLPIAKKAKKYELASLMLEHAVNGYGGPLPDSTLYLLKKKIYKSAELNDFIDKQIQNSNGEYFFEHKNIEFVSDRDLYYSIQHVHVYALGIKYPDAWLIKVYMGDVYNFDEKRDGLNMGAILNNCGLKWQNINAITPYDWEVSMAFLH